MYLIFLIWVGH